MKNDKKLNYDGVIIRNEKVCILSGETVEGESYTRKEFDNRVPDWWWIPYIGTTDSGSEIHNKSFVFRTSLNLCLLHQVTTQDGDSLQILVIQAGFGMSARQYYNN